MSRSLLAEFADAEAFVAAARRLAAAGYAPVDALSPHSVESVDEALGLTATPIRWPMLIAGLGAAAAAYALEYWTSVYAYPIDSGGRPLNSWPVFVLVPFEVAILAAGIAGFVALLILCGLPRLDHPIFDWDEVSRASDDRFFLVFAEPEDEREAHRLREILLQTLALRLIGPAK
jgi:hypothetical protein